MEPGMKFIASPRAGDVRAALLLGVAGLAGLPSAAFAQDEEAGEEELAEPAPAYTEEEGSGNLIVVTATKRERTLQDTPVAVSVTTGETIERAQIRDLKDLQSIVPSLKVTQLQSSAVTNFVIRGFGNGANNAGIEPSVGVFVDGVYRSRAASQITDLPNVQRVEVLRGPQSTLFGKNASAGVVSIVTQEPQFAFGGSMEASYGNYDAVVLKGYLTGPISENVAVSLAGGYNRRDGYLDDLGTGGKTNDRNRWFVRGQALIEPSSDFKIRLIADYGKIDEICCGVVNLQRSSATDAINLLGGQVSDPAHPYADVVYNNFSSTNEIENYGFSGHLEYNLGPLQFTSITAWRRGTNLSAQDPDFSSADLIYPISADVKMDTFTQEFRVQAEIGDMLSALLGVFYINEDVNQTSALTWGSQARPYADLLVRNLSGGALSLYGGANSLETLFGAMEGDPAKYAGSFFQQGTGNDEHFTLGSEAFSIFGQVDFEIVRGLTLTLGGNYTKDSKNYSASIASSDVFSKLDFDNPAYAPLRYQLLYQGALGQGLDPATANAYATANMNNSAANPLSGLRQLQYLPPFLPVPNSVEDGKISDDNFSYTIRLAYDLSPNINLYASYATGFKAASVNLSRDSRPRLADAAALADAGLLQVNQTYGSRYADPEDSAVYEFGMKGSWPGVSANLAVFKQEIKGFQSNIFTGTGFELGNAGKQSTFGVEFEGQARPFPGFTASLGVTYLDPKYDDFVYSAVGDLSGTTPAGIPEWTVVLGGQYDYAMSNGDHLILNATYHYESEAQIVDGMPGFLSLGTEAAIAAAAQFPREVNEVDASLTYAMANGLELSLWGRNITNNRYLISLFDSVAQPFSISGYPNQPRTYGVTARFKW